MMGDSLYLTDRAASICSPLVGAIAAERGKTEGAALPAFSNASFVQPLTAPPPRSGVRADPGGDRRTPIHPAGVATDAGWAAAAHEGASAPPESGTLFRRLLGGSPLPMWLHDLETRRIVEVNDAALALYGFSRREFLGLTWEALDADAGAPAVGGEPLPAGAARHRLSGGGFIDVEICSHAVSLGGRRLALVTVQDLTERKRIEREARDLEAHQQKMEAAGRLAGGLAHEFNNVLAVLLGYNELLRQILPNDARALTYCGEMREAIDRAADLTRRLRTFSRNQPARPQVVRLNAALAAIEKTLRRGLGDRIRITLLAEADPDAVRIDPAQLEQLVTNLVLNARDATPPGGVVTLRTSNTSRALPGRAGDPSSASAQSVTLSVADNGCGMDSQTLARIFEPFFTTKGPGKGTGLGLATVFGIIRQSRGEIEVESEPEKGTCFRIYLPHAGNDGVTG